MRIILAFATFFKVLFNGQYAQRLEQLESPPEPATPKPQPTPTPSKPKPPARSEAITLLATLQREARFVDIVMEPLDGYSDAQVGAATRDVLRDCGQTLERLFAIKPVVEADEGAAHETPTNVDAGRYRLTGNVTGEPPYTGQLVHHGWQATRCELPSWTGGEQSALIVAPVELELK